MTRRARARALAAVALAAALTLSGCGGDDEDGGVTDGASGTAGPAPDTDAATDGAAQTAPAPTGPPTAPADIAVEPGSRSAGGGTAIVVEGDRAAFVLPSGNVACTLNDVTAVCEVDDRSFTPRADHLVDDSLGDCTAEAATAIMINDGPGAWTCVEDPIRPQTVVSSGGWWAEQNGSETLDLGGATVAVLPYGSSISIGQVTCSAAEAGVSCSSGETGRSFFVSRSSYQYG
ncbi:hypothetical protein [Ornithinimicrobium cerasi]|uniref:hypothetical protein n=1 Tax=Ornithinimicrobium cerasi TaxID=2248773 RepID=UPI000EFDDCD5|nr:hypothetical protein [Ornithinimicrobium cerasi]